jgi:uncharacterized protein (TIGR00730 family)
MRKICVFCGSSPGVDPRFIASAKALGRVIAETDRVLVYGGAKVGLMGALADAALAAGGKVIGVMPRALVEKGVAHDGLTELHVVSTMHERKGMMAELSDAFIAMPGGLGTLEEFFEMWTWGQLGLHQKPLGFLGAQNFFAPLLQFLDLLVAQRFLRPEHRQMAFLEEDPGLLLQLLARYKVPSVPKWIDRGEA